MVLVFYLLRFRSYEELRGTPQKLQNPFEGMVGSKDSFLYLSLSPILPKLQIWNYRQSYLLRIPPDKKVSMTLLFIKQLTEQFL